MLAQGLVQDNESSKIYYYLRTGMPVICEEPVPNISLIEETGCGAVVPYDDVEAMSAAAAEMVSAKRDVKLIAQHMIAQHSWDARAALYDQVLGGHSSPLATLGL